MAVIGAGELGGAILDRLEGADGLNAELASSTRRVGRAHRGSTALEEDPGINRRLAEWADAVFIGVRPTEASPVVASIAGNLRPGAVLIVLAIGVDLSALVRMVPRHITVARAMPNLPSKIGRGVIGMSLGGSADSEGVERVRSVLSVLGTLVEVPDKDLDVLSAVSGVGPAYMALLTVAWSKAAESLGFDSATALRLVQESFHGTLDLLAATAEGPVSLLGRLDTRGSATHEALAKVAEADLQAVALRAMLAAVAHTEDVRAALEGR